MGEVVNSTPRFSIDEKSGKGSLRKRPKVILLSFSILFSRWYTGFISTG
eukprot:XP_001706875.1 Hypothetical protein GL50803_39607 [Giardia lamblia ATCC 50803]